MADRAKGGNCMQVITVTQLNRYVKSLLDGNEHLKSVYISGEISNFTNHYKSGHLYMTLKDEGAAVKAVMFRGQAGTLRFTPENGMKVIVRARVSLYDRDGSYQIYIDAMQPDGVGALQVAYEQLKAKLAEEGLFDDARKRPLPKYPSRVGVITSPTGAAVRDIMNVLGRRYPLAEIVFCPVLVQGAGAPPQLVAALRQLNQQQAADVIIIGRGGGSIEDLWAFNDETVARAVAASVIPVISAVGHETDFTICDFVADLRAPTPSAAAELAVPEQSELRTLLSQISQRTAGALAYHFKRERQRLDAIQSKRCLQNPLFFTEEQGMRLDFLSRSFLRVSQLRIGQGQQRLSEAAAKLDALSPLKVLGRGYAIAYKNNEVIKSVHDVTPGDSVSVRLTDGSVDCTVK